MYPKLQQDTLATVLPEITYRKNIGAFIVSEVTGSAEVKAKFWTDYSRDTK